VAGRIMSMKNSNDTIGNSAVPQPTADTTMNLDFEAEKQNLEFQSSILRTTLTKLSSLPVEAQELPKTEISSGRSKISIHILTVSIYL
jgi:hypothetical protein